DYYCQTWDTGIYLF
nr:immunoglobulin light chain junction region [Macaca mulatta]